MIDWQNDLAEQLFSELKSELDDVWQDLSERDKYTMRAVTRRAALMQLDKLTGKGMYNERDWQLLAASLAGVRAIGEARGRRAIQNAFLRGVKLIQKLLEAAG
jgi:hypothetical protein